MTDADEIEEAWRRLVDGGPHWWSEHPVFRAAYENSTLRALFPFPSHGSLSFYATAWPPYPARRPGRLAFVVGDGPPWNVYRGTDFSHLAGAAESGEEAVALLVAIVRWAGAGRE